MAHFKLFVFVLAVLTPLTIILAQSQEAEFDTDTFDELSYPAHSRQRRAVITCNFGHVGYLSCISCNTVRTCYPFGIGVTSTCSGSLPYCRYGRCSATEGALCPTSTTSSTTTTTHNSTSG